MVSSEQLSTTKSIQQRTGTTFHVATRVLPKRIREPTYVLYAFSRVADEVVDDADAAPAARQRERLDEIEAAALGERETDDPVLSAFREVKRRHGIADREVEVFLDAMRRDVDTDRYESHEELSTYLRGSAAAVGHMMTSLMEPDDPAAARPHATALGEAFQLSNFLRDVREDVVEYGRIYVPRETLREHGVDEADVESLRPTPEFRSAIEAELVRTERLYDRGVAGIPLLPEDCQFAVLLSAVLYVDHHRLVRARDCDVLSATPELSMARRLRLAARTWYHWRRTGDPVESFYAASVLDRPGERDDPAAEPVEPGSLPDESGHASAGAGPAAAAEGPGEERAVEESYDVAPGLLGGSARKVASPARKVAGPARKVASPARKVASSARALAGSIRGGGES